MVEQRKAYSLKAKPEMNCSISMLIDGIYGHVGWPVGVVMAAKWSFLSNELHALSFVLAPGWALLAICSALFLRVDTSVDWLAIPESDGHDVVRSWDVFEFFWVGRV